MWAQNVRISKEMFMIERDGQICKDYDFDIEKWVGEGGFGRVYRAIDRVTGEERAIKQILKDSV